MSEFDDTHLIELLKARRKGPPRLGLSCLNELDLSAYADNLVTEEQRNRIQTHLADCQPCRDQLSFLVKVQRVAPFDPVPVALLSQARQLTDLKQGQAWRLDWRWSAAGALAVSSLLVALLTFYPRRTLLPGPATSTATSDQLQSGSHDALSNQSAESRALGDRAANLRIPSLLSPLPGSSFLPEQVEFRWDSVVDAVQYELCIVTPEGEPVWNQITEATSVRPLLELKLTPGVRYFVWVRAYLRDGKIVRSKAVPFTVLDRN